LYIVLEINKKTLENDISIEIFVIKKANNEMQYLVILPEVHTKLQS